MKEIFADKLVTQELHMDFIALPSPDELKGKILIKVGYNLNYFDCSYHIGEIVHNSAVKFCC
jgi:hypothetical protein